MRYVLAGRYIGSHAGAFSSFTSSCSFHYIAFAFLTFCILPFGSLASLLIPEVVDVGAIYVNCARKFEFTIKNSSDGELEITRITPACSCTKTVMEGQKQLAPGDTRRIVGDFQASTTIGRIEATIEIDHRVNDGPVLTSRVSLVADVVTLAILDRSILNIGELDVAGPTGSISCLISRGNSRDRWTRIEVPNQSGDMKVTTNAEKDGNFRVNVQIFPSGMILGKFRNRMTLRFFNEDKLLDQEIPLIVCGRIIGPISATPATLFFGVISDHPVERTFVISSPTLNLRTLAYEQLGMSPHLRMEVVDDHTIFVTAAISVEVAKLADNRCLLFKHSPSGVKIAVPFLAICSPNQHKDEKIR